MNNTHAILARTAGRSAVALAMLMLTVGSCLGADDSPATQSDSASAAKPKTSVSKELQRLFDKSGTPMPSMQTRDLPYATTPQMHRVRKMTETPAAPPVKKEKKNLISRIFGRFRPKKAEKETIEPQQSAVAEVRPPEQRNIKPVRKIDPVRNINPVTTPEQKTVRNDAASVAKPSGRAPSQVIQPVSRNRSSKIVRKLPAKPKTPQKTQAVARNREIPKVDLVSQNKSAADEFANPFEEFDFDADVEEPLDLDAVAKTPEATEANPFAAAAEEEPAAEESAAEEQQNPFTGLRLAQEDEFANPFEDAAESAMAAADETEQAIDRLKEFNTAADDSADPVEKSFEESLAEMSEEAKKAVDEIKVVPAGTVSRLDQASTAAADAVESAPIEEPQGGESLASAWRSRDKAADTSNANADAERRLAVHRAPAERKQPERWQDFADTAEPAGNERPEFGERITATPVAQAKKLTPAEIRRQKIESRKDQAGFLGFCPVVLREERDLVDASQEFEATFGLNTYQFSSLEAAQQFQANPTRYAPAAGGTDVVALVNSGEQHAGSLRFAMWYRDRLYLFRSAATMRLFRQDPASFADQY